MSFSAGVTRNPAMTRGNFASTIISSQRSEPLNLKVQNIVVVVVVKSYQSITLVIPPPAPYAMLLSNTSKKKQAQKNGAL